MLDCIGTPISSHSSFFFLLILSLLLIQEGQLSVLAKEYAQYWLTA